MGVSEFALVVPPELYERLVADVTARIAAERAAADRPEFLTVPETAELLRCSRQRVDNLLSAGRLPRVKDGGRTLIRRADLDAYLDKGS
ncbi:MAG: helix-turn-helix domain-containing protein [Thermoleophilia bacterium]|nr:helix-turn-helix domain-containing protein [Thermoleophilia bacterium]